MVFKRFGIDWRLPVYGLLAVTPLVAFAATPDTAGLGQPVPDQVLAQNRGGHAIAFNSQYLNAELFDNQAAYNRTGNNRVSGQAFAGTSGIPTVIQNSGSNVIIQNATIVNVHVQ